MFLMFWAWYLDICCLCFVSDVLADHFLSKSLRTSSLLKFFQAVPNVMHGHPSQFYLGVFILSYLFSICSHFGQMNCFLTTCILFSLCKHFPFWAKYPSFLNLKLWPWNKNQHPAEGAGAQSLIFLCHVFTLNICVLMSFILPPTFHCI